MKYKRIISLLLCMCLLSSFFTVSYATENTDDDTYNDSVANDEISYEKYWGDKIIDEENSEIHLFASSYPETLNDMRTRAEAIINYKWTPSVDISTWNSNKYNGSTVFKKGTTVTGMPYTLFTTEISGVSDSLLSLAQYKNKATSNFSSTAYCVSVSENRTGPAYGSCCATFVSEVFGGDFMSGDTPRYDSVSGLEKSSYTTVYTDESAKVSQIKEGDALSIPHHVIWVGEITDTTMTIYEQTPPVAIKKTISKPAGTDYLKYGGYTYKTIIRPNSLKNQATVLSTPSINLNGKVIGTLETNAENKVSCKVGDTVIFGWSGINNASTYQYAVVRLPVGHTPNPNNSSESAQGVMLKEGSGSDSFSISLTEAGVYKFAVGAKAQTGSDDYIDSSWAQVYLNVTSSGNENASFPSNVKAKLSSNHINVGESVTFSISATNASGYYVELFDSNDNVCWNYVDEINGSKTYNFGGAGEYYFKSYAENDYGKTDANIVYLTVDEPNPCTTPIPPTSKEGILILTATESNLEPYPASYSDVHGNYVTNNLQRIWPSTYSCDSSTISWTPYSGTMTYRIAVRDLVKDELIYEVYQYYDTEFSINKLFKAEGPVRIWVGAYSATDQVNPIAQGHATYYMAKPTMEWTNSNEKEYYLIGKTIPVNVYATGLTKVIAYYKRSNDTEWTKFGETNSSAGADINETINLDTTGMRKGTYRVRLEGYINDDMTPMTHTLDEFVLRTYPPEKTIKKLYLRFDDGTTMVQNGDRKEVYTNEAIPFKVIAQFEDGNEADISNESLTFDCDNGISVSRTDSGYVAKLTNSSIYSFDIIHDEKDYGCFNFSAKDLKKLNITGNSSRIHLREGAAFEFEVIAEAEDKWNIEYEYPLTESELELTSANSSVATTKTTNEKCVITAVKEGQTTVTIKYKTVTKIIDVYVYPKVNTNNLVSISCETGSNMTVFTGSKKMFDVYANYSDGTKEIISGISGLSATIDNTSVANVVVGNVGNGNIITGEASGTTTMTLLYGGKTCKVSITVKEASTSDIKEIKLTGENYETTIANNATIYLDSDGGEVDYIDYGIVVCYTDMSYRKIPYDRNETDSDKSVVLTANNSNVKIFNPSGGDGAVRFAARVDTGTTIVTAKYKGITQKYNIKIGSYTPVALSTTTELIEIKDTKAKFRTTVSNGTSFGDLDAYPYIDMYDENGEYIGNNKVNINTEFTTQNTAYEYWVEGLKPDTMYRYGIFIYTSYLDDENWSSIYFITNPNKTTEFVDLYVEESDVEIPVGTSKNIEVYAVYDDDTKKNVTGKCDINVLNGDSSYLSIDDDYVDYFVLTAKKECSKIVDISFNGKTIQMNVKVTNPKLTSITTGTATKTSSSITLNGSYSGAVTAPSEYGFMYSIDGVDNKVSLGTGTSGNKTFSKTISGLKDNTLYNYRSYAVISGTYYYGESKTITTVSDQ